MSKKIIKKNNVNSFDDTSKKSNRFNIRWLLVFYDICIYAVVCFLLLMVYEDVVVSTIGNNFQIAITIHFFALNHQSNRKIGVYCLRKVIGKR